MLGALKPVKKFTDRKTAVDRIWDAMKLIVSRASQSEHEAAQTATRVAAARRASNGATGNPRARE